MDNSSSTSYERKLRHFYDKYFSTFYWEFFLESIFLPYEIFIQPLLSWKNEHMQNTVVVANNIECIICIMSQFPTLQPSHDLNETIWNSG